MLDAIAGFNKQIQCHYTLVNYSAEDIDPKRFVDSINSYTVNKVCTAKEMEVFMGNNIPVTYAYHGKYGKQIATTTVYPSQCKSS